MAYKNVYQYSDGYTTSYSSNYYAYQVAVIFAIVIAGLLFFGICVGIIYFAFVKRIRRNAKQRRIGSSTASRTASILRPTTTYKTLRNDKSLLRQPHDIYVPIIQETPILQSPMHSQPTYISTPPMYAVPGYSQSRRQQHPVISTDVQSHQTYPTSRNEATTTVTEQNIKPDQYLRSFHTSSV